MINIINDTHFLENVCQNNEITIVFIKKLW